MVLLQWQTAVISAVLLRRQGATCAAPDRRQSTCAMDRLRRRDATCAVLVRRRDTCVPDRLRTAAPDLRRRLRTVVLVLRTDNTGNCRITS